MITIEQIILTLIDKARENKGNLFILAPEDHRSHISRKLEESVISARIIYFPK